MRENCPFSNEINRKYLCYYEWIPQSTTDIRITYVYWTALSNTDLHFKGSIFNVAYSVLPTQKVPDFMF
jgi:hypothetical protein